MSNDEANQGPLVSVVITTYNRAILLKRAIESAIKQTYNNLEVIVVDDGSTDNTQEAVKSFCDERIKYIRHSRNKGVSCARNTGIKNSQGDFLALLDSDDEYLPEKIEKSMRVFRTAAENVGMVCSNFWKVGKRKKLGILKKIRPNYNFPSPSAWVLSRRVFKNDFLFDEALRVEEDREFIFRFCKISSFYFIDEPLVVRYETESSLSFDIKQYVAARKTIITKHYLDLKKDKRFLARQFYRLGKDLLHTGEKAEGRRYFLKAFFNYPLGFKYFFKFLGSFSKNG